MSNGTASVILHTGTTLGGGMAAPSMPYAAQVDAGTASDEEFADWVIMDGKDAL